MPGSGKSSIGKILANELGYVFIDLDSKIEKHEGATIEAIFELKGEAYFRQIEAQVLSEVSEKKGNLIIATGGGTPCFYGGLNLMLETGKTVFINVKPKVLIDRLEFDAQRPLLKGGVGNRIQELYKERIDVYLKAEIIIETDESSIKKIVELIRACL